MRYSLFYVWTDGCEITWPQSHTVMSDVVACASLPGVWVCGRVAPTHADAAPGSRVQGPGRSGGASGAGGVQVVLDCWWATRGAPGWQSRAGGKVQQAGFGPDAAMRGMRACPCAIARSEIADRPAMRMP